MDLFCEHSEPYSATWPTSGMTRNGRLFPLPPSAPPTVETGYSSLLPTPTVADSRNSRNATAGRTNPDSRHHSGMTLCDAMVLLPTPRATDGTKGGPNQRGSHGDLMLPSAVLDL